MPNSLVGDSKTRACAVQVTLSAPNMRDTETTVETLKNLVRQFARDRNWEQFHTPKNLAMSIAIEAAEIMEHFQWLTPEQAEQNSLPPEKIEEVAEECADVLAYLLGLADRLEIDLASALESKMRRNEERYPAAKFRDRYGYDDPQLERDADEPYNDGL